MTKRKKIPRDVRNEVLVDAMHRCCLCPEHHKVGDLHHVVPISEGGPNTEDNLMAVCPTCHAEIHRIRNRYTIEQLRMYKERWVRLCALGLPLDVRIAQAFDTTRPPTRPQMPAGIPAPPSPYIAHPYPAQEHFTGRGQEREQLTAWLTEDDAHPLLAMIAIGGMGKSALAWHWVQNDVLRRTAISGSRSQVSGGQPETSSLKPETVPLDGILWWSFYDRESGFERFLERAVAYASGGEVDATGWPVRDRMECLRGLLAERRFLLVLDGAERLLRAYARLDAPYLGDEAGDETGAARTQRVSLRQCADPSAGTFLQWLAGLGTTKTLLTSRLFPRELEGLAGVARLNLRRMDPEDAVRFFRAMEIRGTRTEIEAACAPYGYLPLALLLLGGLVAEDPERPGDVAVATDYEVTDDLRGKEQHHILERAYDALIPAARELLSRIAAFRAPVGYKVLRDLFGPPTEEAGEEGKEEKGFRFESERALKGTLRGLVKRGLLLRQEGTGHYDLHPVVRRYGYDRLADKAGTHTRLRYYFAAVPEPDRVESLDDLAPTIELYHHTVRAGRYDEAVWLFGDRLNQPLYYRFGAHGLRIELMRALFPGGEPLTPSGEAALPRLRHEAAQAWTLNGLANSYALSGQPSRAASVWQVAVPLVEKLGETRNLAINLVNLATQQLAIGALAAAGENLRRSIALGQEIEARFHEAVGHQQLGRLLAYTGAFEEAGRELDTAFELAHELGQKQNQGLTESYRALRALMTVRVERGEKAEDPLAPARRAHELALTGDPNIGGAVLPRDLTRAEWLLGAAHRARGEPARAEPHLAEALRRCRRINMVDHEPDILLELARLRREQTALDDPPASALQAEAEKLAREALEIADRCEYRLVQADCHNFLAQVALEAGDLAKARQHAETARERAECDGPPHRYEVAYQEAERLLGEIESLSH